MVFLYLIGKAKVDTHFGFLHGHGLLSRIRVYTQRNTASTGLSVRCAERTQSRSLKKPKCTVLHNPVEANSDVRVLFFSFQLSRWGGTSVKAVIRPCAVFFCLCMSSIKLNRDFIVVMPRRKFLAPCVPFRPSGHVRFAVCRLDSYLRLFLNRPVFTCERDGLARQFSIRMHLQQNPVCGSIMFDSRLRDPSYCISLRWG